MPAASLRLSDCTRLNLERLYCDMAWRSGEAGDSDTTRRSVRRLPRAELPPGALPVLRLLLIESGLCWASGLVATMRSDRRVTALSCLRSASFRSRCSSNSTCGMQVRYMGVCELQEWPHNLPPPSLIRNYQRYLAQLGKFVECPVAIQGCPAIVGLVCPCGTRKPLAGTQRPLCVRGIHRAAPPCMHRQLAHHRVSTPIADAP